MIIFLTITIILVLIVVTRMDTDLTVARLSTTTSRQANHWQLVISIMVIIWHWILMIMQTGRLLILNFLYCHHFNNPFYHQYHNHHHHHPLLHHHHHHHDNDYGTKQAEFPNFSWRGYAGFSQLQDEVISMIRIWSEYDKNIITIWPEYD